MSARTVASKVALLRLNCITLRLGGQDLFEGTTWTINNGEQWAVLGANGSGKSTLLRAISGEIPICKGEIEYFFKGNRKERYLDSPEDAIAYVSTEQHRALVAGALDYQQARWSPVAESDPLTVSSVLSDQKPAPPRKFLRMVLAMLNIEHLIGREIKTLSNGETRKVLVARALLSRPKLLILDDPFAGLDWHSRRRLKKILHDLMLQGMPIIISTHRTEELPSPVTHVLGIADHEVILQGSKRSVESRSCIAGILKPLAPTVHAQNFRWRTVKSWPGKEQEPVVQIKRANIVYDRVSVLRNVNWTIKQGEKWVLRGPNGSGKSSLISLIIADHPQAYANDICIFGRQRGTGESIWEIKEHIGWLAPELQYHYYGDVTCFEVVCSGLYDTIGIYREGSVREIRAVRRWMRIVGVSALAEEPFGALSDGQQRMVLLARALVKEPPLVILDEPCQGLDPMHRCKVLDLIGRVARQSDVTLVYVTHHRDEMPDSFTHELLLRKGRVVQSGAISAPTPK